MQTKNFRVYDEENMAVQDAYALLTANLHFRGAKESIRTIAICSCIPKVGKTTTAINLSISMARSGWKTLMVDADLRKPGTFKRLNNEAMLGLSDIIEDNVSLQDALSTSNIPNLSYLSCGKNIQNPIEMMCSANFDKLMTEFREQYDFVIFDTPALASVIDGALVASKTDVALLVAEIGTTRLTTLNRAKEQLENANACILGVVMNKVEKRDYVKYVESYNYFKSFNKTGDSDIKSRHTHVSS